MGNLDRDRAFAIYEILASGGDAEEMLYAVLPGAPASKSRPRFGKGGRVYSSSEQRAAEEKTAWQLRKLMGPKPPLPGNVALGCVFFRPNSQRIDTDNLLKHVCDAANGILWVDDSQVTAVLGQIELDADNPRTVIVVGKHESSLKRGVDAAYPCAVCSKPILLSAKGGKKLVSCSPQCANVRRGYSSLDAEIPCGQCGIFFRRTTSRQRFCGRACGAQSRAGKSRLPAEKTHCPDCSKRLTHNRGGRCRDCWKKSIKVNGAADAPEVA